MSGIAGGFRFKQPVVYKLGHYGLKCEIVRIALVKHIAEQLFEYVKGEAKKMGCYEITLNVWEGNEARFFYDKMGMKILKTQMEYIL